MIIASVLLLSFAAFPQVVLSAKIAWRACDTAEFNTTMAIQCGTLHVPLDYTDTKSERSIGLELVKIPALVQPSRGSIQLNFGGPGVPTRATAVAVGPLLQVLSGGVYDLIGFDPRGTGTTIPFVCTKDTFTMGQILNELRSTLESDTAARRIWERGRVDGNICQQSGNGNETAEFIGTAFVARDIVKVAEALEEDGMVRYWGFSYGTTLGATLAAMFPDKIDKLVIDGVQNPHEYNHAHADFEEWSDSDSTLTHFFASCITAPPGRCALAALNKTAAILEADTWSFLSSIRTAPIAAGTTLIDYGTMKSYILAQLKYVGGWPLFSTHLASLLYGTRADKVRTLEAIVNEATVNGDLGVASMDIVGSLLGIHCGDRTVRLPSWEAQEAEGVFARLYNTSRLVGDVVAQISAHCAQWPWHAREVYGGDFRVKTANPIMVASTVRDSHTPLRSARNVSSGFEGSGLLVVNGTGHATLNAPSVCGLQATVNYWVNGTLPKDGMMCDAPHPFEDYTWANVIAEITGQNATALGKRDLHRRWL